MLPFWFISVFGLFFSYTVSWYTVEGRYINLYKCIKILLVSMDSDAVFHGESESIITFQIWLRNSELALILREKYDFCSCKTASYALTVFDPFLHEKNFWGPTFLIQKWSAQKTLQTLQVLVGLDVIAGPTGEIPWIHPSICNTDRFLSVTTSDSSKKSFNNNSCNQVLYFKHEFKLNSKTYWKIFCHFYQKNQLLTGAFEISIIHVVMPPECLNPLLSYTRMWVITRSIYGKKISLGSLTQREKSPKH